MSEALIQRAVQLHQNGDLSGAAALYDAILRSTPRHFQALYLLGFVHFQRGEFEDAERLIGNAIAVNPRAADALYNRGCALQKLQRHTEALGCFDQALALKPDYDEAWTNRGTTLMALRRHAEALSSFERALALKPRDREALSNRAATLFELRRYEEAGAAYDAVLAVDAEFPYARGNAALCRAYCCDWHSLDADRARLHADLQQNRAALSPHASTLISYSADDQLRCAQVWVNDRCPPAAPFWRGEKYAHDKVRVAYLSADFHSHATAYLAAGLFEHHDRTRFETTAISFGPDDKSEMRARLMKSFDRFIDVQEKSDADVAAMLKSMQIDIAVDLKGFTQDARPGIFAFRPAPLQVNYLGHPGTMGAAYIDYIIADELVIPAGDENRYSEKVVRLPHSYQANDSRRRIAGPPPSRGEIGLPDTGFVFCSLNSSYKITPEVFDIWMRLLKTAENSVLWLLDDNGAAVRHLKQEAEARGVASSRLIFAPRASPDAHLARHAAADLFLDTLPCNAHTTASDALFAGLPLVTCKGTTFAGRVAASVLSAIGLSELVADSLSAYESKALALATDPSALSAIRSTLAGNLRSTPLFDTAGFTRDLEAAFTAMIARHHRGEAPQSFMVSPV